ncbi:MAG: hypothetical protein RL123_1538 [Pseudomonadota bacterium]|jgi:hypothetical protein
MANPLAGEVEVEIDGVRHVCRLTLGAIAEMEAATGESVIEMVERFETGRWRAGDVLAVLVAGLRGGGWRGEAAALRAARIAGGPGGAARAAAALLVAAFAVPGDGDG